MDENLSPPRPNASVHQLDSQQLNNIILPRLRLMADSENVERLRQRRFDRDEPPPYRSPTPVSEDDIDHYPSLWSPSYRHQINTRIEELLLPPLSEEELCKTQYFFESRHSAYHPGRRYDEEVEHERWYSNVAQRQNQGNWDLLCRRAGEQRKEVFARHFIKQRWQQLGIWNPEWGIPGRVNEGPNDNTADWKWKWQGDAPSCSAWKKYIYLEEDTFHITDRHHPNSRAVHLREGLLHGQRGPPPPRDNIIPDTSSSAAEAFIISRPWYTFDLDVEEEKVRQDRLIDTDRHLYNVQGRKLGRDGAEVLVEERWREEGMNDPRATWKWKHESPEPLRQIEQDYTNLDLTPSEIDALEAIPSPTPTPPPPPHVPTPPGGWSPLDIGPHLLPKVPQGPQHQAIFGTQNHAPSLSPAPSSSAPQPQRMRKRGRPRGHKTKPLTTARFGDTQRHIADALGPRRSARIAQRLQQQQPEPFGTVQPTVPQKIETVSRKKSVSENAKFSRASGAISTATSSKKRGRGRPPKSAGTTGNLSKPRGITKRRGRPPKKK